MWCDTTAQMLSCALRVLINTVLDTEPLQLYLAIMAFMMAPSDWVVCRKHHQIDTTIFNSCYWTTKVTILLNKDLLVLYPQVKILIVQDMLTGSDGYKILSIP